MSALETVAWRIGWIGHTGKQCYEAFTDQEAVKDAAFEVPAADVEPLTPLAPAQAGMERLEAMLNASLDQRAEMVEKFLAVQARALAAEEQVKVLSEILNDCLDADINLWLAEKIRTALQQKEKPDDR